MPIFEPLMPLKALAAVQISGVHDIFQIVNMPPCSSGGQPTMFRSHFFFLPDSGS